jgi:hypothetical protein
MEMQINNKNLDTVLDWWHDLSGANKKLHKCNFFKKVAFIKLYLE